MQRFMVIKILQTQPFHKLNSITKFKKYLPALCLPAWSNFSKLCHYAATPLRRYAVMPLRRYAFPYYAIDFYITEKSLPLPDINN